MTNSDIDGIRRNGEQGRTTGMGYFENPFFSDTNLPVNTSEQLLAGCDIGNAWAAGWLEADTGRDDGIAKLMRARYW